MRDVHPISLCACHRDRVELGREYLGCGTTSREHGRDRARAGAQVDCHAALGQEDRRCASQRLGLPSRHEDARVDDELEPAEHGPPRDPGERLAGHAASHHRVERRGGVCRVRELARLVVGGDATRSTQRLGHLTMGARACHRQHDA